MSKKSNFFDSTAFKTIAVAVAVAGIGSFVAWSNADSHHHHGDKKVAAVSSTAISIAVVDMQAIMDKSTAVVKISEQIDKKRESFEKETGKKEEYFRKKFEELEKQKTALAKDAFEQKNADLGKEFSEAQKKYNDDVRSLEKSSNDSLKQVEEKVQEIVKNESTKHGYQVVISKNQVIYSDQKLNITDTVLEELNKSLGSVEVKF